MSTQNSMHPIEERRQRIAPQSDEGKRKRTRAYHIMPGLIRPLVDRFTSPHRYFTVAAVANLERACSECVEEQVVSSALFHELFTRHRDLAVRVERIEARMETVSVRSRIHLLREAA